jgi:hypothetical protein
MAGGCKCCKRKLSVDMIRVDEPGCILNRVLFMLSCMIILNDFSRNRATIAMGEIEIMFAHQHANDSCTPRGTLWTH